MMMLRVMMFIPNFISKKIFLAVLVIATSVGSVAFAQRTTTVDAKGTLITTGNIVTESATAPTTPIQGDVWFDTTNSLVKVWGGSMWKTVASTAGETDTSLSQNTTTGVITYTPEDGPDETANVVSAAADNLLSVGADGGAFINQAGVNEPWFGVDDNAAATLNTENIYQIGNVGIGTDSPTQKLDIDGGARIRGALYDADNDSGKHGAVLSSTGAGGTSWESWLPSNVTGVSAGYRAWEFADNDSYEEFYDDFGFAVNTWIPIPFNSTPALINSTGELQSFTFNADGSIWLEDTSVYRISVSISVYKPGYIGMRLVGVVNPSSNILAQSTEVYSVYSSVNSSIDGVIISPPVRGNYRVEFFYTNTAGYFITAPMRYNQILPRATIQIEVLK